MKKTTKTLAMILMAATSTKAMEKPILVTASELTNYELKNNLRGFSKKLFELGILVTTNKNEIYIFNDVELAKVNDEAFLSIISNLVSLLTESTVVVEPRDWKDMTPTTQDYKK